MIIDLSTIEAGPRQFDFTLKSGGWQGEQEDDRMLGLDGPVQCHVEISRAGIRYIIDGKLSGYVRMICDRCLEPYRRLLDFGFQLFLSAETPNSDQSEIELSEEEMAFHFLEGNNVDLDEIIWEQIYILLPIKSLCREDCSGLCTVCGVNLNTEKCECQRGEGHPGFSKLKALLRDGDH